MGKESVHLYINSNILTLKVVKNSPLLTGMNRIFFMSVVGFEQEEDFFGYKINFDLVSSNTILEILKYLEELNMNVIVDDEISRITKSYNEDVNALKKAKEIGIKFKSHPTLTFSIPSFKRKLKPYQIPAVHHMLNLGNAANFSVPGSGKTSIVYATFASLRFNENISKLMVIGPRASFMTWEEEYYNCFLKEPKSIRIIGIKSKRKRLYDEAKNKELILLTYQMASQDIANIISFLKKNKVMLVLDESHYIKRLEGGKWASAVLSIAPYATNRIILTGTPIPNSILDIWSQILFLWPNPSLLGNVEQFKNQVVNAEVSNINNIRNELYPFYWRIKKSDLKLRRPKFLRFQIKMNTYQQSIYDALATKVLSELVKAPEERIKLRVWRKAKMIRLLQTASNPMLLTKYSEEFRIPPMNASGLSINNLIERYSDFEVPSKIKFVVDLTKKLIQKGNKVIIWTAFIQNIKALVLLLDKYKPRPIYGEIPKDKYEDCEVNREKFINEFKTTSKCNILIANPGACAESVSLHKVCHHAIYLDRTFNGAQYMQSLDRIHRIGLKPNEQVHYYILKSKNTIDDVIDQRLEKKQENMLKLLDEDLSVLDLESNLNEFTEETQEDIDFNAMIKQLKKQYQ